MRHVLLVALFLLGCELEAQDFWWQQPQGPAYQILVYSFADSDGDGRGDLAGVTQHLDDLQSLGATAVWLSPLHPSGSYHGYDVIDYQQIEPTLGSLNDFDHLVEEAHHRGIRVLMDMVFNHTSSKHSWFRDHPDWYLLRKPNVDYGSATMGGWVNRSGSPAYFATFWDQMPDLDVLKPAVVDQFHRILKFWMDRGVDGFRFDAAKEILSTGKTARGFPVVAQNKVWWNALRDWARSVRPDVFFIGEVSTTSNQEIAAYAGCFDSLFDFPQAKALVADLPASGEAAKLVDGWVTNLRLYGRTTRFVPAPFLSNHDQDRTMSVALAKFDAPGQYGWGPLREDGAEVARAKHWAVLRAKDQAFAYLALPGLPFIYYGEELGLVGRRYASDDVARRDALPWGSPEFSGQSVRWAIPTGKLEPGQNRLVPSWSEQSRDPESMLSWYRVLGALHREHPALRSMSLTPCRWAGANSGTVAAWFRQGEGETLLAAVNFGPQPVAIVPPEGAALKTLVALLPISESKSPELAPGQAILWKVVSPME